ncbi:ribonucleotide reductase [Ephemerocybe angulata]|uniref:Ribonucleoside-diphosphate reductase n=1 Tax=Ephemerocybe angulata TaxID=980116 RepID=A0A8H6HDD6_9AGAR|nr:ribonucleotide reductase [Tulosesus angulatus]
MPILNSEDTLEEFDVTKVVKRLRKLVSQLGLSEPVDGVLERVAILGREKGCPAVDSCDIDSLLAEISSSLDSLGTIYRLLSAALELGTIYTVTRNTFSDAMRGAHAEGLLDSTYMNLVVEHEHVLNDMIHPEEDTRFEYLALRLLRSSYLLRSGNTLYERPQYMWLRSALHIHGSDLKLVHATYVLMSTFKMIPSTTMLANSCLVDRSIWSEYYIQAECTSDRMLSSLTSVAKLWRDGVRGGFGCQSVPARRSLVGGVLQAGLRSTLDLINSAVKFTGRRPLSPAGDLAVYLEPWHAEIDVFLKIVKYGGVAEGHGNVTHYGLILNDTFMRRVQTEGNWTLFCPSKAPLLTSSCGAAFETEYLRLEAAGVGTRTVSARGLWKQIMDLQLTTGRPSIIFKDAVDPDSTSVCSRSRTPPRGGTGGVQLPSGAVELACCNTVVLILPSFLNDKSEFDYLELERVTRHAAAMLHGLRDRVASPMADGMKTSFQALAGGIKTLGLADVFALMNIPYDSVAAKQSNVLIAETIQYCALDQCSVLSLRAGSISTPLANLRVTAVSSASGRLRAGSRRYDWNTLGKGPWVGPALEVIASQDPTVDIALLVGYAACSDPFRSLVSAVDTTTKVSVLIPKHFILSMEGRGLWSAALRDAIIARRGSIQGISSIPEDLQRIYKTAWEVDQLRLMDMSADRASFLCLFQDMNLYMVDPSLALLVGRQESGMCLRKAPIDPFPYPFRPIPYPFIRLWSVAGLGPPWILYVCRGSCTTNLSSLISSQLVALLI